MIYNTLIYLFCFIPVKNVFGYKINETTISLQGGRGQWLFKFSTCLSFNINKLIIKHLGSSSKSQKTPISKNAQLRKCLSQKTHISENAYYERNVNNFIKFNYKIKLSIYTTNRRTCLMMELMQLLTLVLARTVMLSMVMAVESYRNEDPLHHLN